MLTLKLDHSRRTIHYGDLQICRSPKFFEFYGLLALKRVREEDEGFVSTDEIWRLPRWRAGQLDSVGKAVRRHIEQTLRPHLPPLIEYRQKINGPFRLSLDGRHILTSIPLPQLEESLGIEPEISRLTESQLRRFYAFVVDIWRGIKAFNEGGLTEANRQFRRAAEKAVLQSHLVAASFWRARVHDRRGEYEEALKLMNECLATASNVRDQRSWAMSKVYGMLGWLAWRSGRLQEAEAYFKKAQEPAPHDLHIAAANYNGLALIARATGNSERAVALHHSALECAVLAEDFYVVQASYFNLGKVHAATADRLWSAKSRHAARDQYRIAVLWMKECISLCDHLVIADDTSDDRILLSHCLIRLGKLQPAREAAAEALRMAKRADNQRCMALSFAQLIAIAKADESDASAQRILAEALNTVRASFHKFLPAQ